MKRLGSPMLASPSMQAVPSPPPLAISWAEHWEDVRLWRVLGHLEAGFYVDVGAMDPSTDSVTKGFYERGWSGLDVEPNPYFADRLRSERPRDRVEQVAAGRERGQATMFVITSPEGEQTGLTTLEPTTAKRHGHDGSHVMDVVVDVVPLAELMEGTPAEDPSRFHFLKVDVEGHESAVLAGADLHRFRPLIILVEARAPRQMIDTYAESEAILVQAGYTPVADDGLNRWYARSEDAGLAEVLALEVNPLLDGRPRRWWEFTRERELVGRMEELDAASQAASREADGLREETEALREEARVLRARIDALTRSWSWRATAPLRALRKPLRRRRTETDA
jgi:FkbM family methyltransferase